MYVVYLIFNQYVLPEFKQALFGFVSKIIKHEFKGRAEIQSGDNFVDFGRVGDQLSRKVTAPFFEPVVEAFNRFYFSPETGLYAQRDFAKLDERTKQAAEELGLELSHDKEGRLNNITYHEARALLDKLGYTIMSLSEYWKILSEAAASHDEQMMAHLRCPGFVEFLDTVILDGKYIIDHPKISKTREGYSYEGERKEVEIPEALPGLIYPEDIDAATGFPRAARDPRQYGDKRLWRYWSPDAPVCIATRGHIFLINQSSFDTKIHPDDALPNLGIRPCAYKVTPPQVEIFTDRKGVRAKIT